MFDGGDGDGFLVCRLELLVEPGEWARLEGGPFLDAGGGGGAGFGMKLERLRRDGAIGAFGDVERGGEFGVGLFETELLA